MDADRIAWTHYRTAGGTRQPIAPASETREHQHYTPSRRAGLGSITSTRPTGPLFRERPTPPPPPEPDPCQPRSP